MKKSKSVLLIENSSSDFLSARLSYAKYLINNGYKVYAFLPTSEFSKIIESNNINLIEYKYSRNSFSLFIFINQLNILIKTVLLYKIEIVHSFRFYPNFLNTLQSFFTQNKVILHVTGLGILFSKNTFSYSCLRVVTQIIFIFKFLFCDVIIFQNEVDKKDIWFSKFWKHKIKVIYGSGIDVDKFNRTVYDKLQLRRHYNYAVNDIIFICTTRLIWEKGIKELVDAFLYLQSINLNLKLLIVGNIDIDNPRSVDKNYINSFSKSDVIYFLGHRNDITELLALSDIFIYPSYYREGIPRSLLEALSMSLPVITTNMPGCNLTVFPNKNGTLIEPKSSFEIINAVIDILNIESYIDYSEYSRSLAINIFSTKKIYEEFIKNY